MRRRICQGSLPLPRKPLARLCCQVLPQLTEVATHQDSESSSLSLLSIESACVPRTERSAWAAAMQEICTIADSFWNDSTCLWPLPPGWARPRRYVQDPEGLAEDNGTQSSIVYPEEECATCLDDPTDTHTQDSSSNLELELEVLVESLLFSESLKRGGSVLSPLSPESRKSIVTRTAKSLAKTLQTMEHMQRGILEDKARLKRDRLGRPVLCPMEPQDWQSALVAASFVPEIPNSVLWNSGLRLKRLFDNASRRPSEDDE